MVIVEVRGEQPHQVPLVEDNHVVEQLATDRADEPLDAVVRRRRAEAQERFGTGPRFQIPYTKVRLVLYTKGRREA